MASAVFCCPFKYFSKSRLYHLVDNLPVCATAIYLAQRRGAQSSHRHPQRSRRCPRHPGLLPEGFPCFPAAFLQLSCCFPAASPPATLPFAAMPAHSCTHSAASAPSRRAAGSCRRVAMGLQAWHGLQPVPIMACTHHGLLTTRPAHKMACPQ